MSSQKLVKRKRRPGAKSLGSVCVYTALIGGYEPLNEQPVAAASKIPFICFTDDQSLQSETWQMRPSIPTFAMDAIRSQRALKLRPHHCLPEFDYSLYIDNSVILSETPERIIEEYRGAAGFALPEHSYRETVLDEFLEVATLGLDDPARIFEQLNHYSIDCAEVLSEKPYWAGILLRDHRSEAVRAMLEIWLAHVQRYSRRDQLSANLAFRLANLKPEVIRVDNYSSWFHSWPSGNGRDRNKAVWTARDSFSVLPARVKEFQLRNETLERRVKELEAAVEEIERKAQWLHGQNQILNGTLSEIKRAGEAGRGKASELERELAAARQQIEELLKIQAGLTETLANERETLRGILESTSWKLTRPLRGMRLTFGKLIGLFGVF